MFRSSANFAAGMETRSVQDGSSHSQMSSSSERARVPGLVEFVEANEPRLIAFNEYVNEAGDEVSVVQVHPDAASMEAHIAIVAERARAAYAETLDATVRIQVFGQPSEEMLAALRQQAGEGVEIALHTEHLGGFTRVSKQD